MAAGNRKSSNKRKTQTKKERMAEMEKAQAFRVEVTLWIVVAAALLLFISNLGFGGAVGKTVSGFLFGMFGLMAYVLPVLLLVGSFFAVSNRGNKLAAVKLIAAIVFLVFLCTFMGLAHIGNMSTEISSKEVPLDPGPLYICAELAYSGAAWRYIRRMSVLITCVRQFARLIGVLLLLTNLSWLIRHCQW